MILEGIEKQLNKLIALDENSLSDLASLQGKVIQIDLLNTRANYYLCLDRHGIQLRMQNPGNVDVTISGTPTDLLAFILRQDEKLTPAVAGVELKGNVALAQDFQHICRNIDIDWEEGLSRWLGDGLAHHMGRFFRGTADFIDESSDKIQLDVSEYLRYEKELNIERREMSEFSSDVDKLRNDLERLKWKIDRLEKKTTGQNTSC